MTTKSDLRRMVLAHLTVIDAAASTVPAEMASLADLWIDGARALLLERGLCWWDEDDIPQAVSIPLARYIAAISCAAFGRRGKGYEAEEVPARMEIAGLKSTAQTPPQQAQYY